MHQLVWVKNCLISEVIGGRKISSCEVFESCSRKFKIINSEIKVSALEKNYFRAFCIGSNIIIFHNS